MLVYNKRTKEIMSSIPDDQSPRKYNNILEEDVAVFISDTLFLSPEENIKHYLLDDINELLIKRPDYEIDEINKYGRVLTEEQRIGILLQPSQEEVQKANNTIEILSILQEVYLV